MFLMKTALKKVNVLLIFLFTLSIVLPFSPIVFAVDYDAEIEQKEEELEEAKDALEESKNREYTYEQQGLSTYQALLAMEQDVAQLEEDINAFSNKLSEIERAVDEKSEEIEEKTSEINEFSRSLYKISRASLIEMALSSDGISQLIQRLGVQRYGLASVIGELRAVQEELSAIAGNYNDLSDYLVDLDEEIARLEEEKQKLAAARIWYQNMAALESRRQASLSQSISSITAEQQKLVAAKLAATQKSTTIGEYEQSKQNLPAAPFSPAFAVVSIGYPHRVGMSQYGAYGRALDGQNYQQILSAYYTANITNYPVPEKITVSCSGSPCGTIDFEDQYMKGIAEMPTSWGSAGGMEALKAQAIAARSYALAYTNDGSTSICSTTSCQVYNPDKVSNPAAADWHAAVDATRGMVLTYGGDPITAYYCSTAGGYTRLPTDFDVGWYSNPPYLKRVVDFGSKGAYDGPNYGNSPWYYKAWYAQSDVHPWLTENEMVDLLNSALLSAQSSGYNKYLSHPNLGGWTAARVESELVSLGITPIPDVSSITVINHNTGYSSSITVSTSSGNRSVSGVSFGDVFVLRSRGYLALWSRLYDIVQQ